MEKISILYKVMEIGAEHEYYSMTSGSLKFQEMQQLEIFQTSWSQDLFTHENFYVHDTDLYQKLS